MKLNELEQIVDLESAVEDFDTNEGRQAYFKEIETYFELWFCYLERSADVCAAACY